MKLFSLLALTCLCFAKEQKMVKIKGNWYNIVKVWNSDKTSSKTTYVPVQKFQTNNHANSHSNRLPNGKFDPNNAISDLSASHTDSSAKNAKNIRSQDNESSSVVNLSNSQQLKQNVDDLQLTIAATVPISQMGQETQRTNVQSSKTFGLPPLSKLIPYLKNNPTKNVQSLFSKPAQVLKTLEEDEENNLSPTDSVGNVMIGKNNAVMNGQNNKITGASNLVKEGNSNHIKGDSNTIQGNGNRIYSRGAYVEGNMNIIHN